MDNCKASGCRKLKTICETCGRTVSTATFREPQEWISVKESLPKKMGKHWVVYGATELSNACVGDGYWGGDAWIEIYPIYCQLSITHWMPLPEPPNEMD